MCDEAETVKVRNIVRGLENPLTKPLLHFLSFILPSVDRFNRLLQKSTENTNSQVYDEMTRLVRLYASNFLTTDTVLAAGGNLRTPALDDEELGIGSDTWVCIGELEAAHDTAPFFKAVSVYVNSTKKMLNKFLLGTRF